jgi:acetyl/propionyl-CoA carboxylase alpha subunit
VLVLHQPQGDGVRWDSGVIQGGEVTAAFDPMIAKLIIRGKDRDDAIAKADKALRETVLLGCKTNTAFLRRLIQHPAFIAGDVHTGFLDANPQIAAEPEMPTKTLHALLSAASLNSRPMRDAADTVPDMHAAIGTWRN